MSDSNKNCLRKKYREYMADPDGYRKKFGL